MRCSSRIEDEVRRLGFCRIAGIDEAGRGSLFGPVYAAAVILDPARPVRGLADSKILEPERREELAALIRERALCWAVAWAEASEIDSINILQASKLAMRRAVEALSPAPDYLLIDFLELSLPIAQRGIVKGDAKVRGIAAASILAKVDRDHCLCEMDRIYPGYGLASHKGYGTPEHREALTRLGPTPQHRRSFAPVMEALQLTL